MATDPSQSTIVCITPPPAHSESPAATAPPEKLKNEQLFSAAGVPPDYSQQPQNPGQATFPPHVESPASPVVGPEDINVVPVKGKKCTCRNVLKVLGYIGLGLLVLIFFIFFLVAKLILEEKCSCLPTNCSERDDSKQ